jgi:hypothetical protein
LDAPSTLSKQDLIPDALVKSQPSLIFSLLNLKVSEIFAGGNHNIVFAK